MTDRPMTYEELAAVMRELRESGHLTSMPATGFGMPDLDVLRGRGAIPGKPLQAMSGPAPLPPWADVARSFTPIGGVDEAPAILPRPSMPATTDVVRPLSVKVWPVHCRSSAAWVALVALPMVAWSAHSRRSQPDRPKHNKRQHRLTMG